MLPSSNKLAFLVSFSCQHHMYGYKRANRLSRHARSHPRHPVQAQEATWQQGHVWAGYRRTSPSNPEQHGEGVHCGLWVGHTKKNFQVNLRTDASKCIHTRTYVASWRSLAWMNSSDAYMRSPPASHWTRAHCVMFSCFKYRWTVFTFWLKHVAKWIAILFSTGCRIVDKGRWGGRKTYPGV
jgi:hypothetical protein